MSVDDYLSGEYWALMFLGVGAEEKRADIVRVVLDLRDGESDDNVRDRYGMTSMDAVDPSSWWHIVWVTRHAWPPTDERGDWSRLAALYAQLEQRGVPLEMSERLPVRWQGRDLPAHAKKLSSAAMGVLAADLQQLATTDRIASTAAALTVALTPCSAQLLLYCQRARLHQQVGRFKSRSATLLSFVPEWNLGGAGTWGRGFWWARLPDEESRSEVERFLTESYSSEP